MSIETWSGLQRSATDPETIEQAIARLIQAHDDDTTAHVDTGQSLDLHKTATIIDHPAGSVVADKFNAGDVTINTQFDSLDSWSITGDVAILDHNGIGLSVDRGTTNTSRLHSAMYVPNYIFDDAYDMQFETLMTWQGSNSHIHGWFGFLNGYTDSADGFGFQIRDGVLYAYLNRNSTVVKTSLSSVNIALGHVFKAVYSVTDQNVKYYVDGTLVTTSSVPAGGQWQDDRTPSFDADVTQTNDGTLYFNYLLATRKLLTP